MIFGRDQLDYGEIDQLSWLTTGILISLVLLVGFLEHGRERHQLDNESIAIADNAALGDFLSGVEARATRLKTEPSVMVPTEIWIERLEFADSYSVNIGGEI